MEFASVMFAAERMYRAHDALLFNCCSMITKIIAMEESGICKEKYYFWKKRNVERDVVI